MDLLWTFLLSIQPTVLYAHSGLNNLNWPIFKTLCTTACFELELFKMMIVCWCCCWIQHWVSCRKFMQNCCSNAGQLATITIWFGRFFALGHNKGERPKPISHLSSRKTEAQDITTTFCHTHHQPSWLELPKPSRKRHVYNYIIWHLSVVMTPALH